MEQWGGLKKGLTACSCTIVHWWIQIAPGSCHLLGPLGWNVSGCRHVAALDNGFVNSLTGLTVWNNVLETLLKKEAESNTNMANTASLDASLEIRSWGTTEFSFSSQVNLSQSCSCAHQGSSAMGLSLMWMCFSLLLATPILIMDTQHKWSCKAPEMTGSNGTLFWVRKGHQLLWDLLL